MREKDGGGEDLKEDLTHRARGVAYLLRDNPEPHPHHMDRSPRAVALLLHELADELEEARYVLTLYRANNENPLYDKLADPLLSDRPA